MDSPPRVSDSRHEEPTSLEDDKGTFDTQSGGGQRAAAHFAVADLANSQFVIAQPQKFDEAGFNSGAGYCAWHDYTQPQYYPGVQSGISFTNMPYVLDSGAGLRGRASVNAGDAGRLDGFSIVLGHEVEETITDPGAEDVVDGQNLCALATTTPRTRTVTSARGSATPRASHRRASSPAA